jgi:hypothetical protein
MQGLQDGLAGRVTGLVGKDLAKVMSDSHTNSFGGEWQVGIGPPRTLREMTAHL